MWKKRKRGRVASSVDRFLALPLVIRRLLCRCLQGGANGYWAEFVQTWSIWGPFGVQMKSRWGPDDVQMGSRRGQNRGV